MTVETSQPQPTVDETPLPPTKQRKDSLEAHLKHRPERAELIGSTDISCSYLTTTSPLNSRCTYPIPVTDTDVFVL